MFFFFFLDSSSYFITPQLVFSEAKLYFKYLWEKGVASMAISKNLDITNGGLLPTAVNLLIDPPFSCVTERETDPSTRENGASND